MVRAAWDRVKGFGVLGATVLLIVWGGLASGAVLHDWRFLLWITGGYAAWRAVMAIEGGWRASARAGGRGLVIGLILSGLFFFLISGLLVRGIAVFDRATRSLSGETPLPYAERPGEIVSNRILAERYQPILLLAKEERWRPTDVDHYLDDAVVRDSQGVVVARSPSRVELAQFDNCGGGEPQDCYSVELEDCPALEEHPVDHPCVDDPPEAAARVYARVVRRPPEGPVPRALRRLSPYGRVDILVQYWIFFRYNHWESPGKGMQQWHQGDWEAVTMGFTNDAPLFAAFSSHCGGEERPWGQLLGGMPAEHEDQPRLAGEVEALQAPAESLQEQRVMHGDVMHGPHPLAYVARGSHALYPDPTMRVPNTAECQDQPLLGKILLGSGFTAGARESMTFADPARHRLDVAELQQVRAFPPLDMVTKKTPFMRFAGRWSDGERTEVLGIEAGKGDGPETPALKKLWKDPIGTIFCSPYWAGPAACP
jgi:hypothetical protein